MSTSVPKADWQLQFKTGFVEEGHILVSTVSFVGEGHITVFTVSHAACHEGC